MAEEYLPVNFRGGEVKKAYGTSKKVKYGVVTNFKFYIHVSVY